jgi:hypothetical protein
MNTNRKPLPPEEWYFDELDEREVRLAFFYEFGRSSDKIKEVVEKMRAARPHPRCWSYCPREHHIYEVVFWLARQEPQFPETSWLTLRANTIAKIQIERAKARKLEAEINAKLPSGQKFCGGGISGSPGEPVEPYEWMVRVIQGSNIDLRIGGAGFQHTWMGNPQAIRERERQMARTHVTPQEWEIVPCPEGGQIHGGIDWRSTDEEIIEKFRWFLERERPQQFKRNAKTPLLQRGYDIVLPCSKGAALKWLGILRKRKSVKSWREYVEIYEAKKLQTSNKQVVKSRDITTLTRQYQRDCHKAELILDSFSNGKILNKEDFR